MKNVPTGMASTAHDKCMTNATKPLFQQTVLVYFSRTYAIRSIKIVDVHASMSRTQSESLNCRIHPLLMRGQGHNRDCCYVQREWILVNANANLMACKGTP